MISAPSGAGKTSLVRELRADCGNLHVSVSHTTRVQRPGERDGEDYHFIAREKFVQMVEDGDFLEHARVFDHDYGTSASSVNNALEAGRDIILEIDWQGARQVRERMPDSVSVFILPPSLATLEQRLKARGQDSADVIARRMRDSVAELSHFHEFDYLVVNDDFDTALAALKSIFLCSSLRIDRQRQSLATMLQELLGP